MDNAFSEDNFITYHMLLDDIENNDMIKFKQHFTHKLRKTTDVENVELLYKSMEEGCNIAFDLLMASGVDYNREHEELGGTAIYFASLTGNWYCLEALLQKQDTTLLDSDVLCCVVHTLNSEPIKLFCDHWKCFNLLLNSEKVNIDDVDEDGETALHAAVQCRNNKAIKKLLDKGADLCIESEKGVLAIKGISPDVLEEHFNYCIGVNCVDFDEKNSKIFISFKNFISDKNYCQNLTNDMSPITFIANSKPHQHLLQHPVITSFLFLKWHKISMTFYINFLVYLLYALSIITHIVLKFRVSQYQTAVEISAGLSCVGTLFLIARESLQFIVHPKRYLRSVSNYVEVILITLSLLTCTKYEPFEKETHRIIAVFTILLSAVELCLLVGYIPVPSISTHILMLEAVCKSFWKSFLLYSILIISFALSFFVMNDISIENFSNPLRAFTKTIVMLTGEFDAADFEFKTFYSYLLFLLFVCFMTIILFNLLNGLAVADTQTIQEQGELNYLICRTNLLANYQQLVLDCSKNKKSLVNYQPFRSILECYQNVIPDCGSRIAIFPNDNNNIVVPTSKSYSENTEDKFWDNNSCSPTIVSILYWEESDMECETQTLPGCFSFITNKCFKMDEHTVKLATTILEKRRGKHLIKHNETVEDKLKNVETNLTIITNIIEEISQKMEKKVNT